MPTYEYACRECGHRFEIVQSMKDEPLKECPECKGELRKVFAPPAIAFKGSGFYATDHGKKAKKSTTPEPSSSSGSSNGSSSGASDSKSSEPAASKPAADTGSSSSDTTTTKAPASASKGDSK